MFFKEEQLIELCDFSYFHQVGGEGSAGGRRADLFDFRAMSQRAATCPQSRRRLSRGSEGLCITCCTDYMGHCFPAPHCSSLHTPSIRRLSGSLGTSRPPLDLAVPPLEKGVLAHPRVLDPALQAVLVDREIRDRVPVCELVSGPPGESGRTSDTHRSRCTWKE